MRSLRHSLTVSHSLKPLIKRTGFHRPLILKTATDTEAVTTTTVLDHLITAPSVIKSLTLTKNKITKKCLQIFIFKYQQVDQTNSAAALAQAAMRNMMKKVVATFKIT
jgi:hypothetical protein